MPTPGLKVTEAVVSIDSGGVPLFVSSSEKAMLKHDECAAAISSSGVVVVSEPSLRAFQLTSNVPECDESSVTVPDPSNRVPFQAVDASLVAVMDDPPVLADSRGRDCPRPA